jgi:iron complex outermembrane receptor protein
MSAMPRRLAALPLAACATALAQAPPPEAVRADPIVVTATRTARATADVPASVDAIDAERIHAGQLQVNLSETLPALAGVVANNRQNYAQDLQVSIRGFGARSTFGVRGLRVIVDGIPATLPDGQAQISHVDLASAGRIEVLRGPFSVLYGNASGGVINVVTQSPPAVPEASANLVAGSDATWRAGATAAGRSGSLGYALSAGRFETDGYRDHSAARRTNANATLGWEAGARTSVTLVANAVDMPGTQDPLGLTRAQYEANPRSVDPVALQFDTRKSVDQAQAGLIVEHALDAGGTLRASVYAGDRGTQQFQAIPVAVQANPLHPGGMIDLDRAYSGIDARWTWTGQPGATALTLVAGANADGLAEDRRGFQNFSGAALGVQGALRRDETNRVVETAVFAQAEWDPVAALRLLAGVRATRVAFRSEDHYVTGANPDDSGRVEYRATTPAFGLTWRLAPSMNVYAAAGRGFETPTTNELAYRSGGASGLNLDLRPAKSDNFELGAKWTDAAGWRATAAIFRIDTDDEIVVDTNAGGRSTFRNAGGTRRDGIELQAARDWGTVGFSASASALRAVYRDLFAGNRIPGIPAHTGYLELHWRPDERRDLGLEVRHSARLYVNDANSDAAEDYTVASLRAGYAWRGARFTTRAFLRIDNLFGRRYAGSVIVNEGNQRYFEPAPGRTWLAGLSVTLRD